MEEQSSSGEGPKAVDVCLSEPRRFRLTKDERIRSGSDYQRIAREGVHYRTRHFHIRMTGNTLGTQRLGMAVGRKVGKACVRNRIKRRLREYFRLNRDKIPAGTDTVFIAVKGSAELNSYDLARELDRFFFSRGRRPSEDMP